MGALIGIFVTLIAALQSGAAISVKPSGPKFEVASIKPAPRPTGNHAGITADGARVDIGDWSVLQLIDKAYRIQSYQVIGPARWEFARIGFDIEATLPPGSNQNQIPEMLQWLLAKRFGLAAHADTKELRGLTLTVGKGGLKAKAAPPEPNAAPDSNVKEEESNILDELFGAGKAFGTSVSHLPNGDMHLEFQKLSMRALAVFLSADLRVPVKDMTGLDGKYQVTLEFDPMSIANQSPANDASAGDLFMAVRRLGLQLEKGLVRSRVLVVDHVEQVPTAN